MRYFLKIAYNGSSFHGWQSQPNALGVQSVLEKNLSTILKKEISLTGAGRTDAGVHAREMVAHFDYDYNISDVSRFLVSLNNMSGKDIVVSGISQVEENAHARFDACKRTYKYFISYKKDPFLYPFYSFQHVILDLDKMNEAAELLITTKDFTSFAKLHSDSKTNICNVTQACWSDVAKDKEASDFIGNLDNGIVFTISADRFLRNMVRAIVGTLLNVGRNKITCSDFKEIIDRKNRCEAGESTPSKGLFLWEVKYPFPLFFKY